MSLLAPAALGLLALSVPLVVLYMLRSRRQRFEVPSTRLWQGEEQFVSAAIPWQRLKITAALLLQLLAIALFAFLLARPFFRETTLLGPHTVMVIDTSGSMATAGRLKAAKAEALRLVEDASEANLVSIVEAGPRSRVLAAFSRDPDGLGRTIEQLQPTGGTEDLAGAIRLARGLATPDRPTTLLLLTDGGTPGSFDEPVNDARHLAFTAGGDDVAITAFGAGTSGESGARMFLEVTSASNRIEEVIAGLTVDGLSAGTVEFTLEPGGRSGRVIPVDAGDGSVVEVELVGHADANPLNDGAAAILTGGADVTVAVLGEGSVFLDALIDALPGVRPAAGEPPDVAVIDGSSAAAIDRPTLVIAPEEPPPGVTITGVLQEPVVTYQRPGEPILEGLDLGDLVVAETQIVEAFGWLPLVRAGDVPLILLGDVDGQRVVYLAFDIVRSNLPVQVTFPILGSRLFDWLGGGRLATTSTAPAGTPIPLATPPNTSARVVLPDGSVREPAAGTLSFTATDSPGVYRVEYVDADGDVTAGPRAARQFAAAEATAAPREISTTGLEDTQAESATLLREWAPLILALLVLIVLVEWWVAFGRPLPGGRTGRRRRSAAPEAAARQEPARVEDDRVEVGS